LEEVISYVVGLKKRLAELEGVSEDNLTIPQADVSNILNGVTNSGGNTTVLGNPAVPPTTTATSAADGMHVTMVGGMPGQAMAVQGPVMTGMPLQDGRGQDNQSKPGMSVHGMTAPALNANQACSGYHAQATTICPPRANYCAFFPCGFPVLVMLECCAVCFCVCFAECSFF
jgi:hypothetical protein